MKNLLSILVLIVLGFILTSCSGLYKFSNIKTTSFTPDRVRLNLENKDFEFLGEMEISYASRTYLGFINLLDSLNNEVPPQRVVEKVQVSGFSDIRMNDRLKRAAIKVVNQYPTADYYLPLYSRKTVEQMFMGKRTYEKMLVKVYKLKHYE
jgi:hypothetical protein